MPAPQRRLSEAARWRRITMGSAAVITGMPLLGAWMTLSLQDDGWFGLPWLLIVLAGSACAGFELPWGLGIAVSFVVYAGILMVGQALWDAGANGDGAWAEEACDPFCGEQGPSGLMLLLPLVMLAAAAGSLLQRICRDDGS